MPHLVCADMQKWLQQTILSNVRTLPDPALCEHVATCPLCQGVLAVLAIEALGLRAPPDGISCQRCEEELAAFIDHEAEEGSAAAIRAYPQIWWHLWTCEDCAETYRITRSLLAVEQPNQSVVQLMPVTLFGPLKQRPPALRLPRAFLYRALAGSAPASNANRGAASFRNVLAEKEISNQRFTVSVQRQVDGEWQIHVAVKPPPVGWLILMLGATRFRARFDRQGEASIQDVPFALLTTPDGPDMGIDIEPDME